MPQNPAESTLFVSRIEAGSGISVTPTSGTGIVEIAVSGSESPTAIVGGATPFPITGKAAASATAVGGTVAIAGATGGATSGAGGVASVTGGAAAAGSSAGGVGSVAGGAGHGASAGGNATVTGGLGGATGGGGGALVTGGAGGATSGNGGAAGVTGGAATTSGNGGVAGVTGGAGADTGNGGIAAMSGGASGAGTTGAGGSAAVQGGNSAATNGGGGAVSVLGGTGRGTGAGGEVDISGGVAGATGNGGDIVMTGGTAAGGVAGNIVKRSVELVHQGTPAAKTTSATLTTTEVLTGIITVNQGAAGASALQLPAAASFDTALPNSIAGDAFDFSVINISTNAAETASLTTNTSLTLVGDMDIQANSAATTKSAGRFRARKTGTGAWTVYRLS